MVFFYSKRRGVLNAKGEYIGFLDGDDMYINNIFEKCYEVYKENETDIISFGLLFHNRYKMYSDKFKPIFAPSDSYYKLINKIGPYIWRRFYKNDFFKNTVLKLKNEDVPYNMVYSDDWLLDIFVYKYTKSVQNVGIVGYIYFVNPKSAMHKRQENKERLFYCFITILKIYIKYSIAEVDIDFSRDKIMSFTNQLSHMQTKIKKNLLLCLNLVKYCQNNKWNNTKLIQFVISSLKKTCNN